MSIERDREALGRIFRLATASRGATYSYTPLGGGAMRTLTIPTYTLPNPRWPAEPLQLYDVRHLFPDDASGRRAARTHKTGLVCHHDAVAFPSAEQRYTGHTVPRALQRLHKIHRYHLQQGWGGTGYMDVTDLDGRIFITGSPDQRRAHVAAADGQFTANDTQHGSCMMGHYSDRLDPHGNRVSAAADRPTDATLHALDGWWQLLASVMGRTLRLTGHLDWQTKECPGSWYSPGNWAAVRYHPQPLLPPAPPPPPPPPPPPAMIDIEAARRELAAAAERIQAAERLLRGAA